MFSKACEYGIKAAIHICRRSQKGERVALHAIASAIDSPVSFTAKILQSLARDNIISSIKGPTGGYEFSEANQVEITLLHIVRAIDGDKIYHGCGLGLAQCNASKPCPLHDQFKTIRDELKSMLESTTINELTNGLHQGTAFLKR